MSLYSRRRFLALCSALPIAFAPSVWATNTQLTAEKASPRIGLALGSGGAKGLAHIPVFEMLDQLGIRPYRITGTSIGAIMGMLYSAGLSGKEIRELFDRLLIREEEDWRDILQKKDLLRWLDFIDLDFNDGGLIDVKEFLQFLQQKTGVKSFSEFKIPLQVVASELWTGNQVIFSSGAVLPAIQASMAVPGLFAPVYHDDQYLVDGGVANPVPYDLLLDECDIVIAVDVLGQREIQKGQTPSLFATIFTSFTNMQRSILTTKLAQTQPHMLIRPDLVGIRVLEFYKAEEIYRQAAPSVETARLELEALLGAWPNLT